MDARNASGRQNAMAPAIGAEPVVLAGLVASPVAAPDETVVAALFAALDTELAAAGVAWREVEHLHLRGAREVGVVSWDALAAPVVRAA